MELVIGRDAQTSCLTVKIDDARTVMCGDAGSVPRSVSRQHCKVKIEDSKSVILNVNPSNQTMVNGVRIEQKTFDIEADKVVLGSEDYVVDFKEIMDTINLASKVKEQRNATPLQKKAAEAAQQQTFSISHLESVWNDFHDTKLGMQIKEKKMASIRSITGIFSMSAVACGFIPGIADILALRIVLYGLGFVLMIYFFVAGYQSSSKTPLILDKLDKDFHDKYVCSNPKCHHFLGYQPYNDLKKKSFCPYCKSKFTQE